MEENNTIDQKVLAEDVSSKIPYEFLRYILVKPLPRTMVKREMSVPVPSDKQEKSKDGINAINYDKVEKKIIEEPSHIKQGIVLKIPVNAEKEASEYKIYPKVGDTICYDYSLPFDILKDSQLVRTYDIVCVKSND